MPTGCPGLARGAGAQPDKSPEPVDKRDRAGACREYLSLSFAGAAAPPDLWVAVQRGKRGQPELGVFRHPQPTTAYANRLLIHGLGGGPGLRTVAAQLLPRQIVSYRGGAA